MKYKIKFKTRWVGHNVNINYYEKESSIFTRYKGHIIGFLAVVLLTGIIVCGCGQKAEEENPIAEPAAQNQPADVSANSGSSVEIDVDSPMASSSGDLVSYDVTNVGRSDPFMPHGELGAYNEARNSAIAEANAYNARIAQIKGLEGTVIREKDDISPYSFNLPVPPTALGPETTAAATITRTKVVGIMYNEASPSAIINIDDKDYLVRTGDKILDNKYKVMKINPNWITVSLGSNIYSAAIGELFSKDGVSKYENDLYNLKNRFGGRKG